MEYRVLGNSRRIEKRFLEIINIFSKEEQKAIWQILLNDPKGNEASHCKIKKVYKDICSLTYPMDIDSNIWSWIKNTMC